MRIPVAGPDLESILRGAEILSKHWIKNERTTLYLTSDGKYCCVVESTGLSTAQGIVMFTAMLDEEPPQSLPFLDEYADAPLECDGLTRVAHKRLIDRGIPHRFMVGRIDSDFGRGYHGIHYWIQLMNGLVWDFALPQWFGEADVLPRGVFAPEECQRPPAKAGGL